MIATDCAAVTSGPRISTLEALSTVILTFPPWTLYLDGYITCKLSLYPDGGLDAKNMRLLDHRYDLHSSAVATGYIPNPAVVSSVQRLTEAEGFFVSVLV